MFINSTTINSLNKGRVCSMHCSYGNTFLSRLSHLQLTTQDLRCSTVSN